MYTSTSAHLHFGRVEIGHVHRGAAQNVVAPCARTRCCKLPEGRRTPFFGDSAVFSAAPACQRRARSPRQLSIQTNALFNLFSGDPSSQTRKKYQPRVDAISKLEPAMQKLSDQELIGKTSELKQKVQKQGLEETLVEAFAVSASFMLLMEYPTGCIAHKASCLSRNLF